MASPIRVVIIERDLMSAPDMPGAVWATQRMGIKTCVARGKQSSGLLLHVAEQMGVTPSDCATVCSATDGVVAGNRAGMHVVLFVPSGADSHETPANFGASVVAELRELPEILRLLNREIAEAA